MKIINEKRSQIKRNLEEARIGPDPANNQNEFMLYLSGFKKVWA